MYNIPLKSGGHEWEKQNLVTIYEGKRHYDIMKCKNCGIEGKTSSLTSISIKGSYSSDKVTNCPKAERKAITRIKITRCNAAGKLFSNLLPDSEHDVVTPPHGHKNDFSGVWVMGVGEPVKVLSSEFTVIN